MAGPVGRPGGLSTHRITAEVADKFVELVAEGHTLTAAAQLLGFSRASFVGGKGSIADRDPVFAERLKEAFNSGTETMIEEARRRAVEGWDEPVFRNGAEVGVVRKYDSTLLMFLIKQRDPSFRENARLEIGGIGGGPLEVTVKHDFEELLVRAQRAGILPAGDSAGVLHAEADGDAGRSALLPARTD